MEVTLIPLQAPTLTEKKLRILDFDIETMAAGFADPNWVPQKITCVSWSWVDEEDVSVLISGPMGFFKPELRKPMVQALVDQIKQADMVTGHNLLRFDLPVLNAECLRLGLDSLEPIRVQDTMRIKKTKGFKKGQDNIGRLLKTLEQKMALDWQGWEEAYEEDGWQTIKDRCVSDVQMHKQIRLEMIERGWIKKETRWTP